jgi:hypothetical protein
MLFAGRKLTKRGLDRRLDVTNSAEIINQLRKEGMNILTTWKKSSNGIRYGEYSYEATPTESRIENQTYREFATLKRSR